MRAPGATRSILAGGLLVAMALAGSAAAEARKGDRKAAMRSYEKGEAAYQLTKFRVALGHYEMALAAYRAPAFLFNIAQCHRQLKAFTKALFYYRLYLEEAPTAANRTAVEVVIAELERKLSAAKAMGGRVSVSSFPPGAEVFVDHVRGKADATTPALLNLKVGQHLILIRLPGYLDQQRTVTVIAGKVSVQRFSLVKVQRPAAKRARTVADLAKRWLFWTGLTITAVAGIGAISTGALALESKNLWESTRGVPGVTYDFEGRHRTLTTTTDVLLGLTAAAGIATLVGTLLYLRKPSESQQVRRWRLTPGCGARGCSVALSGSF